jgi:hypothetical protein
MNVYGVKFDQSNSKAEVFLNQAWQRHSEIRKSLFPSHDDK